MIAQPAFSCPVVAMFGTLRIPATIVGMKSTLRGDNRILHFFVTSQPVLLLKKCRRGNPGAGGG
jgi:hypothetical protein